MWLLVGQNKLFRYYYYFAYTLHLIKRHLSPETRLTKTLECIFVRRKKRRQIQNTKDNKNKLSGDVDAAGCSEAVCKICTILSLLYDVKLCSRFLCTVKMYAAWNRVKSAGIAGCRCLHWPSKRQLYWSWFYLSSVCLSRCLLKAFHCMHVWGQEGLAALKPCESHTNNAILCLLPTARFSSEIRLESIQHLQPVTHIHCSHMMGCQ